MKGPVCAYRWTLLALLIVAILAVSFGFAGVTVGVGRSFFMFFVVACVALLVWGIFMSRKTPPIPPYLK